MVFFVLPPECHFLCCLIDRYQYFIYYKYNINNIFYIFTNNGENLFLMLEGGERATLAVRLCAVLFVSLGGFLKGAMPEV